MPHKGERPSRGPGTGEVGVTKAGTGMERARFPTERDAPRLLSCIETGGEWWRAAEGKSPGDCGGALP
ncbi:hypothetical protein E2C01_074940 [Portunus trituberculatus]|uniref:Uncharacterized protein n=1 Tax=Portunus trituberculatus TaxID=210409 RepID=A0A5B7I9B9_PORTR|nr:hypothetical protein [Portunus trituberculatus]